jgi:peptidyl-prolyl cis-trans isomerase A (cyclophilin A)
MRKVLFSCLALFSFACLAPVQAQDSETVPPPAVSDPAASPAPAAPPVAPPPPLETVRVRMVTSAGVIVLALEKQRAPITTANFLRYVDQKRYDGAVFYRAMNIAPGYGLIQGGLRGNPKLVLKPIAHEPTSKTGLSHVDGAISMARLAPGTADAEFFIMVGDVPSLDAQPPGQGDTAGYAVFGRVIEGMDVVRTILQAPTSPTLGQGFLKGQMIAAPLKITSVRRSAN